MEILEENPKWIQHHHKHATTAAKGIVFRLSPATTGPRGNTSLSAYNEHLYHSLVSNNGASDLGRPNSIIRKSYKNVFELSSPNQFLTHLSLSADT